MNIHYKVDSLDGSVVRYIKSIIFKYRVDGVGDRNKKKTGKPTNISYNMFSIPLSLLFMSSHTFYFLFEQ